MDVQENKCDSPIVEIPELKELTAESLFEMGKELEKIIEDWDRSNDKGAECFLFGGDTSVEAKKELTKALDYILREDQCLYERVYPAVTLEKGSNEGYRLSVFLLRNPRSTPSLTAKLIDIISIKLWDRASQFELYCLLEKVLNW